MALVEKYGLECSDASSFDVSRLRFCPECRQLLLHKDGTPVVGEPQRKPLPGGELTAND